MASWRLSIGSADSRQLGLAFDGYEVEERRSARARHIRIEILSPRQVRLVIPLRVARSAALDFLHSRHDWIRQKIGELERTAEQHSAAASPQLRWDGHDQFPLRGEQVPLRLIPAQLRTATVRFDTGITVFAPPAQLHQPARLERCLLLALRQLAEREATRMLDAEATRIGVRYSGPRMADQKSLWGSCTPDGLISLNWRLLLAPTAVFHYVVVHELCHRRHHDHSERFWALVEHHLPEFAEHRRWLREHGHRLHWWLPGRR